MARTNKKTNTSQKPSKIKQKAAAVALYISTVIEKFEYLDKYPELKALNLQCERSRAVYGRLAGKRFYLETHNQFKQVWIELQNETADEDKIQEHEVPYLISAICYLIPPKEFEAYFGIPPFYIEEEEEYKKSLDRIHIGMFKLEEKLNNLLGTKTYVLPIKVMKKEKVKKERTKSKKISKPQKQKTLTSKQLKAKEERERKRRVLPALKELIKQANRNKELNENEKNSA